MSCDTHSEIYILRFVARAAYETEIYFNSGFSEVCHDASVSDSLISADDWFIGCFSTMSTLDTRAYFLY